MYYVTVDDVLVFVHEHKHRAVRLHELFSIKCPEQSVKIMEDTPITMRPLNDSHKSREGAMEPEV